MQIRAESGKSALPICNYSQILYQFLTFTQNLKRSRIICFDISIAQSGRYFLTADWAIFSFILLFYSLSISQTGNSIGTTTLQSHFSSLFLVI